MVSDHPSGNTNPSEADRQLTRRIKEAGELLDIQMLDHIILTKHGHFSMLDEGVRYFLYFAGLIPTVDHLPNVE